MMRRMIGFDRKVSLTWLDMAAGLCQQGLASEVITAQLNQQLSDEIRGDTARRKTLTVLRRIWITVPPASAPLREEALHLIAQVPPEQRLWVHWGMAMTAYPFFRDVAATVGQLGHLQGRLSLVQVRRRMIETWGDRSTLTRAVQRLLRTFVEWDVLRDMDEPGRYAPAPVRHAEHRDLLLWLLSCALVAHDADQIALSEFGQLPYLFPFDLLPHLAEVRRSNRFQVSRQGLDLDMVSMALE